MQGLTLTLVPVYFQLGICAALRLLNSNQRLGWQLAGQKPGHAIELAWVRMTREGTSVGLVSLCISVEWVVITATYCLICPYSPSWWERWM